jgi:phenylpropionate dioxygenase-like ring-hydroxylating dioxygenase large terminal subunit
MVAEIDLDVARDLVVAGDERRISAKIMCDPDLFSLELDRVFGRSWVFVAHESELPQPGDFVTRFIGRDPVIVTRARDGELNVLLNSCSHRGSEVCAPEIGNARSFRCPYHGWTYDGTGELIGVPAEREMYGRQLDRKKLGLKNARVGVYHNLIFATWNPDAPDLLTSLGDMAFYLDLVFGLTDGGLEVLGSPQRWVVDANWKFAADNFAADAYHVFTAHQSVSSIGLLPMRGGIAQMVGRMANIADVNGGHAVGCSRILDEGTPTEEAFSTVAELLGVAPGELDRVRERLSREQIEMLANFPPGVGTVFPNFSWLRSALPTEIGGETAAAATIRVWHPLGPDRTEVWSWCLVERGMSPEAKRAAGQAVARTFGSAGMLEADDAEIWTRMQRGLSGAQGQQRWLRYLSRTPPDPTWPGPGSAHIGFQTEDNQWHFYQRWADLMAGDGETAQR